jgi:hypothetical protein
MTAVAAAEAFIGDITAATAVGAYIGDISEGAYKRHREYTCNM